MPEVEQRREQLPTRAWMPEVEQRREQLPARAVAAGSRRESSLRCARCWPARSSCSAPSAIQPVLHPERSMR
jgi:hypothetical protein